MGGEPEISWVAAQLSDCHVVEPGRRLLDVVDTESFLVAAIDTTNGLRPTPDLVVISGDLVDAGRPAEYEHLAGLVAAIEPPLLLLPGNHDHTATLRATLTPEQRLPKGAVEADGPYLDVVVDGPVRVVSVDTSRGPDPRGDLDPSQLGWLDDQLSAAPDTPTVLFLHHPPFDTGIDHMDAMSLRSAARAGLAEVLATHHQVERVSCGHLHRTISRRFAGTVAATVPSVAHAVAFDLEGGPAAATYEPPALTVLTWGPRMGLVAHQRAIGDFPHVGP